MTTSIVACTATPEATGDEATRAAIVHRPAPMRAIALIARHELRTALRSRMVPAFAALFTVLTTGISLAGLGASGELVVQGFMRTAVSLASLALYVLPLLGVVMGAAAIGGEDGGAELLLAQPVGRAEALLGRTVGLAAALALVSALGFGAAALVVVLGAGADGIAGYVLVALGATAVGIVGVGVGVLVGVLTRRRTAAVAWALALWFAAAVLYDLVAIGVLQIVGNGQPGPWLVALLSLNPLDGVRAIALIALGADVLLGPAGAALERLFGAGGGMAVVIGSLTVWMVAPIAIATRCFARRDF
ncbi:MAG TPA: ABC transporter permease [Gemmatimonadaceae bacterium]